MARYRLQISAVIGALLAFLWARRRIRASRAAAARVPALVDLVLERLAHQKRLGVYGDEDGDGDGGEEKQNGDSGGGDNAGGDGGDDKKDDGDDANPDDEWGDFTAVSTKKKKGKKKIK